VLTKLYSFSPANPNDGKELILYSTDREDEGSTLKLSRSSRSVVLARRSDLNQDQSRINVQYTADPPGEHPVLKSAYVKKEGNNRDMAIDGTFRIFRPYVPGRDAKSGSETIEISSYFKSMGIPDGKITEFIAKAAKYLPLGLGGCGHSEDFEISLGAGWKIFVNASADGKIGSGDPS
jgi:hypothetical protein